jgi:hypothetical protein
MEGGLIVSWKRYIMPRLVAKESHGQEPNKLQDDDAVRLLNPVTISGCSYAKAPFESGRFCPRRSAVFCPSKSYAVTLV